MLELASGVYGDNHNHIDELLMRPYSLSSLMFWTLRSVSMYDVLHFHLTNVTFRFD